jgi:hypothetical protein
VRPLPTATMRQWVEKLVQEHHDTDCDVNQTFEGDGEGDKNAAGIGISPHTLSDSATFTADALFKKMYVILMV